jgi:DNA repair exonuclease SbcCD ATPase subunit
MDIRAFKQVVVIGGRDYSPFMKLKTNDRREFIEDLLDIRVFSAMGGILKDKVKLLKEEVRTNDEELKSIKEKVSLQEAFVKKLTNEKSVSVHKIETGITQLTNENLGINNSLKSEIEILEKLTNTISQYSTINTEYSKLLHDLEALKGKKRTHTSKIKFYDDTVTCPTCTQTIADTHRELIVNENGTAIDECALMIIDTENKISCVQEKLDHQTALKREISSTQEIISGYQSKIRLNNSIIERAHQQIEDMNVDNSSIVVEKAKLKDFATIYLNLLKNKKTYLEDQQYNDLYQSVLADVGIKSKVIKKYIPSINKSINKYLAALDFFCAFYLDENFDETIKSRHRDKFTYDNFSDGQAARIDLALMFAWRDIAKMRNAVNTNLLFLDEADKAIDGEGSQFLIDTLNKVQNSNIFIISHKGDILRDKVDCTIEFNLVNNFTELFTI